MLKDTLTGTTGGVGVYRDGHTQHPPRPTTAQPPLEPSRTTVRAEGHAPTLKVTF